MKVRLLSTIGQERTLTHIPNSRSLLQDFELIAKVTPVNQKLKNVLAMTSDHDHKLSRPESLLQLQDELVRPRNGNSVVANQANNIRIAVGRDREPVHCFKSV